MTDVGLTYRPGGTVVHRLDARTKLLVQFVVALLAFTWTSNHSLPVVWGVVLLGAAVAGLRPATLVRGYALPFALLAVAVATRTVTLGPPWVDPASGVSALSQGLHVAAVLVASAVYVRTTPVAETRAAIARLVPGRVGRLLAAGTAFVLRFLPVLLSDLRSARAAQAARLGDQRPLRDRMQTVATAGLSRAFARSDRFALALKARCFAWNPTPPPTSFSRLDWLVAGAALALAVAALVT